MKNIFIALFTLLTFSLNAQMSPPTVNRSGTSLTQQDNYLTVAKRLGIPTSSTDDLDAAVTAQNSIKLLYNTTLQQLRLYNPVTMTWSSVGGGLSSNATNGLNWDTDSVKIGGNLTEPTYIDRNGNDFIISNGSTSFFQLDNNLTFIYDENGIELSTKKDIGISGDTIFIFNNNNFGYDSLNLVLENLKRKDTVDYILGVKETAGSNPNITNYSVFRTPKSSGGGSFTYYAGNGIKIQNDSISLDTLISQPVFINIPDTVPYRVGTEGDAINLNVPPPSEFSGLISTYTGFDYRSPEYYSFIGVMKGLNFAPLGFSNQDMVGTFTIVGNPFDPINPDGQIFVDGLWYDDYEDEVAMNKIILNFSPTGVEFNSIIQTGLIQNQYIAGDNGSQSQNITGDSANQNQYIAGDNGSQSQNITGYNGVQNQYINGDNGVQRQGITGYNGVQNQEINGDNGIINRLINNYTTSKKFKETITDTKQTIEVDDIELKSNVEIEGSLTNSDGSYYVKSTDLPKKLIDFSGDVTTVVTLTDPETTIFSYKITPDMWKTMSAYELSILGSFQGAATQNQTLSLYMNTTNSIGGSKLWNGYITTNTSANPFGGNAIAIEKKLWKDNNIIITEGGNSATTISNTHSNFDSGVYNNVSQKYLVESTLDFTNDIWLILTTSAGIAGGTLKIKKLLLREI